MQESNPKYLNLRDVADRYKCHSSSVWRWAADGRFPKPIKIGGCTRWIAAELDQFEEDAMSNR